MGEAGDVVVARVGGEGAGWVNIIVSVTGIGAVWHLDRGFKADPRESVQEAPSPTLNLKRNEKRRKGANRKSWRG